MPLEKANIWLLDETDCNERSGRREPTEKGETQEAILLRSNANHGWSDVPSAAAAVRGLCFAPMNALENARPSPPSSLRVIGNYEKHSLFMFQPDLFRRINRIRHAYEIVCLEYSAKTTKAKETQRLTRGAFIYDVSIANPVRKHGTGDRRLRPSELARSTFYCIANELRASSHAYFVKQTLQYGFDCPFRYVQLRTNLLVAQSFENPL